MATFLLVCFTRELTYNDGINFPFNLQGAAITAKDVSYLFQLCLLNQQVMFLLKVLLQPKEMTDHPQQSAECCRSSYIPVDISHTTLHFFPSSSSKAGLFWATGRGVFTVLGVFVLIGVACTCRLGFLWVFWSSDICFRPCDEKYQTKN